MQTAQIKLEDTEQRVEWMVTAIRQRFVVTADSGNVPMHGEKRHIMRRWLTVVLLDDYGEIAPSPLNE